MASPFRKDVAERGVFLLERGKTVASGGVGRGRDLIIEGPAHDLPVFRAGKRERGVVFEERTVGQNPVRVGKLAVVEPPQRSAKPLLNSAHARRIQPRRLALFVGRSAFGIFKDSSDLFHQFGVCHR